MGRFVRRFYELRLVEWIVLAVLAFLTIAYVAPHQVTVTVYKVSLVSLFALLGFRLDRALFPYARPDKVPPEQAPMAGMRRAVVIAAVIIGGTIGV
jgi:hypothetical protein